MHEGKEVGSKIQPGTSALFLYVVQATGDKVIERLRPYVTILPGPTPVNLNTATAEQLDTRYRNWTLRQIVHHLADSEAVHQRFRDLPEAVLNTQLLAEQCRSDVLPRYVQHLSQIHSILAMVRAGLGMAIVPAAAASLKMRGTSFRKPAASSGFPSLLRSPGSTGSTTSTAIWDRFSRGRSSRSRVSAPR